MTARGQERLAAEAQRPEPQAGPPGRPSATPPNAPVKPKWTWWIVPYFGGMAVVIAVAIALSLTVFRHHHGTPRAARSAGATATVQLPAQMFPDALFRQLTQNLRAGNEAAFLSAVAPSAQPAVRTWWDNLHALGASTGLVMPTSRHDLVAIDSHGDGTALIMAGVHNPLDPGDVHGKPAVPLEQYRVGLHFASPTATGQITSWQPLGGAPWDQGVRLYVRKTAHVVVAGLPGDGALVDETLPLAEAAASYDIGLVNHVNFQALRQQGFVVFVSGDKATREAWLAGNPQPKGWPPAFFGARVFQLPGPGVSADDTATGTGVADGTTGGARIVVTPYQQLPDKITAHGETVTLVREFMLDMLAGYDQEFINGIPLDPVPSWSEEGLAVAVQGLFEANSDPAPAKYDFSLLKNVLHSLPRMYKNGHLPDGGQLYGPDIATDENWNDVAASVYVYIAQRSGMKQMLGSALLLYRQFPTPFGNVLKAQHNDTFTFFKSAVIRNGWRTWLAHV